MFSESSGLGKGGAVAMLAKGIVGATH